MATGIPVLSNVDDIAEAIAVPNPNRPVQNAVGEFGRQVCDRLSANPLAADVASVFSGGAPVKEAFNLICGPYWDAQGYSPPGEDIPFSGGQCAVNYTVFATFSGTDLSIGGQSPANLAGPLSAPSRSVVISGSNATVTQSFGPNSNQSITITVANGFQNNVGFRIAGRVDGQPDNCGDPPGTPAPGPNPAPDPGPLPPDTGPKIDIRGNPVLVLPPIVTVTGEVNVGFDIGEVNFGVGGAATSPEPVPGETVEPDNSGEGGGESDFGEPPEGERWVGCCISLFNLPPGTPPIPRSTPQDVYAEVVGNARLKGGTGTAEFFDTPIQLRSKGVCLWEPVKGLRPTGIFVNLKLGIRYTVTPYSVPED